MVTAAATPYILSGLGVGSSLLGNRGQSSTTQTQTPSYDWMVLPSGAKIWAQTGGSTTTTEGSKTSAWDALASGLSSLSSTISSDQVSTKLIDAIKDSSNYKTTKFSNDYFENKAKDSYNYNNTKWA